MLRLSGKVVLPRLDWLGWLAGVCRAATCGAGLRYRALHRWGSGRPGRGGYNNTTHHNNKHPAGGTGCWSQFKAEFICSGSCRIFDCAMA